MNASAIEPRLVGVTGFMSGEVFPLAGSAVTFGRDPDNTICSADPALSRRHCVFRSVDGRWAVEDLGSSNGTFVNGVQIRTHQLTAGDRIAVGRCVLVFVTTVITAPGGNAEMLDSEPPTVTTTLPLDDTAYLQPDTDPNVSRVEQGLRGLVCAQIARRWTTAAAAIRLAARQKVGTTASSPASRGVSVKSVWDFQFNGFRPLVRWVCRWALPRWCLAVCLAFLLCGCRSATPDRALKLNPVPALDYIAEGFDRYPVVALSELHGNRESAAFLAMLIRDDGFSRRVNDIVIEFGNAAYQPVVDRYISGTPVGRDELRAVWENTTQISGIWLLPMYEGILADIRLVNATLPVDRRYRVLLGDPPIDWSKVTSPADDDMNDWRDAHFAWVLEHYVLSRHRRALLFIGGAHISRKVVFPNSVIHLLDARFPGKTLVVSALDRGTVEPAVAAAMSAWPIPSVVPVRGTWLGRSDVRTIGFTLAHGLIQDDVDALLALSTAPLVWDPAPPVDESASPELRRRRQLAAATLPFRGGLIRFEANNTKLTASSSAPLQEVLSELLRDRDRAVLVKAFADARERDPPRLSTERAYSVAEWLVSRGISRDRVESRGCGAKRPLWADDAVDHIAANRRVEIVTKTPTADCEPPRSFERFSKSALTRQ